MGFFLFIARPAKGFLYLKQITHDYKKMKQEKRKKKNNQGRAPKPSLQHLRGLKSEHNGKSLLLSATHLSSPTRGTALELTLSHLPCSAMARWPPILAVLIAVLH